MPQVDKKISAENAGWTFEDIADEFDEHVRRSVPVYDEGHDLVCKLSDFFLPPDAAVIEIGCSTGVLSKKFLDHNRRRQDITFTGIDNVESMLEQARLRCADDDRARFVNDDIVACEFEKSSMIISFCTLQFIHPRSRQEVVNKIYESLEWGGGFFFFEKVRGPDARFQDISNQLYHEFKLDRGFDEVEILNKQRSLKGVLEPFSTQGWLDLIGRAGFVDVTTFLKFICFEGFLAIK